MTRLCLKVVQLTNPKYKHQQNYENKQDRFSKCKRKNIKYYTSIK